MEESNNVEKRFKSYILCLCVRARARSHTKIYPQTSFSQTSCNLIYFVLSRETLTLVHPRVFAVVSFWILKSTKCGSARFANAVIQDSNCV